MIPEKKSGLDETASIIKNAMILRFIIFFVLLLLFSVASQSHAADTSDPWALSKSADRALKNALRKSQQGKFSSAQRIYEKALEKPDMSDTDRVAIHKYIAINQILMGDIDEGVDRLLALPFAANDQDARILRQVHYKLMRMKGYDRALTLMNAHNMGFAENDSQRYSNRLMLLTYFDDREAILDTISAYARNVPQDEFAVEAYTALQETENREATLIARRSPSMAPRATRSGWCTLSVSVSPKGRVSDILETDCSENMFREPTIKAVRQFRYLPKLVNGKATEGKDETLRMIFQLANGRGNIIPPKRALKDE